MLVDFELCEMVVDDVVWFEQCLVELDQELQILLLFIDLCDEGNLFLEVCVGIGGDEVVIFVGDFMCMYLCYVE